MSEPIAVARGPGAEIVTIGTELLLGQIADTNTEYLARELGQQGVTIRFRTAVGDSLEDIERVIRSGIERCDMVIATGGLGPTRDDLTREAVARVAGVDLEFREDLMAQIQAVFQQAGYRMPDNNRRQAFVPRGSRAIPNPVGTAPAFIAEKDAKPIVCLPGVPRELKFLMNREVVPWLRDRLGPDRRRLSYRVLKAVGIGESKVDQIIGDLMSSGNNPEVGLMASLGEIKIRIAAGGAAGSDAEALIAPVEAEIRSRLGNKIFGRDDDTLEGVIDALMTEQGLTLAVLEGLSGGLVGERLHGLPAARVMETHVITEPHRLAAWSGQPPGVTGETAARGCARALRDRARVDVALACTGVLDRLDKGYRWEGHAAVSGPIGERSFSWRAGGDLASLRRRSAVIALNTLRLALLELKEGGGRTP